MMGTLPALTVRNPYALALALGIKPLENRGFRPARYFGQRLAIHAGAFDDAAEIERTIRELVAAGAWRFTKEVDCVEEAVAQCLATAGRVVAVATISNLHRHGDPITPEAARWRTDATFGWFLTDVVRLEKPVPAKGKQSIWNLPVLVHDAVQRQVERGSISASIR